MTPTQLFLFTSIALLSCSATDKPLDKGFIEPSPGVLIHQPFESLPLIVVVNPDAIAWASAVEAAVNEWNETLGVNVFLYVGVAKNLVMPATGIIPVSVNETQTDRADTVFFAQRDTGTIRVCVIFMPVTECGKRTAVLWVMHELGHALGLDHDTVPGSLMFPVLGPINIAVTNLDVEILRIMYGSSTEVEKDLGAPEYAPEPDEALESTLSD